MAQMYGREKNSQTVSPGAYKEPLAESIVQGYG
jgi:hypothetical protein